jgi:hypothetical protein
MVSSSTPAMRRVRAMVMHGRPRATRIHPEGAVTSADDAAGQSHRNIGETVPRAATSHARLGGCSSPSPPNPGPRHRAAPLGLQIGFTWNERLAGVWLTGGIARREP